MSEIKAKKTAGYWPKLIICVLLMFGFRFIPGWGGITSGGMAAIGIFVGLVLMIVWNFGLVTASLLAIFAVVCSGVYNGNTVLPMTMGNSSVVQLFFMFAVCRSMVETGAGEFVSKWLLSRKFIQGKPVVFITGDSTVKNADKDEDGMWGWGAVANTVFDESKIDIVNAAMAGRSCRSYLNEGRWDKVYNSLKPGDFVLIQFGHNDIGAIDKPKYRAAIASGQDTCHVYRMQAAKEDLTKQNVIDQKLKSNAKVGSYEVVYSFGWYLKKFIQDVREKGATPILVSLTPRNEWPGGKIERRNDSYGKWYREVVKETGVEFVDLHNITADFLDKKFASKDAAKSKSKASKYFNHDHTHTSLLGAKTNAQSIAKGLRANKSPLANYLKKK